MALGDAYISLADEPSAIFWNPAGLTYQQHYKLSLSHENLYAIPGFYNDMLALNIPLKTVHLGFGWSQMMLEGEYAEQVTIISGAYKKSVGDFDISLGLNAKHLYAHLMNSYEGSNPESSISGFKIPGKLDADAGALIKYHQLSLGGSARNLLKPDFEFDDKSYQLPLSMGAGLSYKWNAGLLLTGDYHWDKNSSSWHVGSEIWFYNVFAPRLGMSDSNLTAGFGLKSRQWTLDGAMYAHEKLGSTYRVEFGWIF
ncbi:MAG TPA: hypothetical protein PLE74_13195, partial [Candidatus Cloacimonadota bacterium]|nr:hypothetical protein [Candidatus Cloacimonadota bacterium]